MGRHEGDRDGDSEFACPQSGDFATTLHGRLDHSECIAEFGCRSGEVVTCQRQTPQSRGTRSVSRIFSSQFENDIAHPEERLPHGAVARFEGAGTAVIEAGGDERGDSSVHVWAHCHQVIEPGDLVSVRERIYLVELGAAERHVVDRTR